MSVRELVAEIGRIARRPASWTVLGSTGVLVGLTCLLGGAAVSRLPAGRSEPLVLLLDFPGAYSEVLATLVLMGGIVAAAFTGALAAEDRSAGRQHPAGQAADESGPGVVTTIAALAALLLAGLVLLYGWGILAALAGAALAGVPLDGASDATALGMLPVLVARAWWGILAIAAIGFAAGAATGIRLAGLVVIGGVFLTEQLALLVAPDLLRFAPLTTARVLVRTESIPELIGSLAASVVYVLGSLAVAVDRRARRATRDARGRPEAEPAPNHPRG